MKLHVKKGDTVIVLSGKKESKKKGQEGIKGKRGKVIEALPQTGKVVVEGINKVKRHMKPTQKMPQGGIVVKEAPLASSKVMLVCPACDKPTRVSKTLMANGKYARACKKCGEVIDKDK